MNNSKIIREITKQCEVQEDGHYFFDRAKFAELIIRECALVALRGDDPMMAQDILNNFELK